MTRGVKRTMADGTRLCLKCGTKKPLADFYSSHGKYLDSNCKVCTRALRNASEKGRRREKSIEAGRTPREWVRRAMPDGTRLCGGCDQKKPASEFYRIKAINSYSGFCKVCTGVRSRSYALKNRDRNLPLYRLKYARNWAYAAWHRLRIKARETGILFTIAKEDLKVPEFCPVLGIRLQVGGSGGRASSPSVDRLVPALGYIPGNVHVISMRANAIKNDATAEELRMVVSWVESVRPETTEERFKRLCAEATRVARDRFRQERPWDFEPRLLDILERENDVVASDVTNGAGNVPFWKRAGVRW